MRSTRQLAFLTILGCIALSPTDLCCQSASELARAADAAKDAQTASARLLNLLKDMLARTRTTKIELQRSLDTLRSVGLEQAATDVAAQVQATEETENHLATQVKRVARLITDGASDSTDPLMVVKDGIADAMPKSNSRNRLKEQNASLVEWLEFVRKETKLRPFAGLVQYHIGENYFQQAKELIRTNKSKTAAKLYVSAINSFEQAADGAADIKNAGVGTSLRATSIYKITTLHAALWLSRGLTTKSKQKRHENESKRWFRILADEHPDDRLENGSNVVRKAQEVIRQLGR